MSVPTTSVRFCDVYILHTACNSLLAGPWKIVGVKGNKNGARYLPKRRYLSSSLELYISGRIFCCPFLLITFLIPWSLRMSRDARLNGGLRHARGKERRSAKQYRNVPLDERRERKEKRESDFPPNPHPSCPSMRTRIIDSVCNFVYMRVYLCVNPVHGVGQLVWGNCCAPAP